MSDEKGASTEAAKEELPGLDPLPKEPNNVVEALACVMHDLPGIGKMTSEERDRQQGRTRKDGEERGVTYAYRSIEQITAEAQSLFARYGVVFVPHVEPPEKPDEKMLEALAEIVRNGTPQLADLAFQFILKATGGGQALEREFTLGQRGTRWTDTYLSVTYRIYGPGGTEDFIDAGPFLAVGRDNSDKGFNKAMTQAYKQCLLQVLCVADPADEGEHERHFDEDRTQKAPEEQIDQTPLWAQLGYSDENELQEVNADLKEMMGRVPEAKAAEMGAFMDELGYPRGNRLPVLKEHVIAVRLALAEILAEAITEGTEGTEEPAEKPPVEVPMETLETAIAAVQALPVRGVTQGLTKRGLSTDGPDDERRRRLALAMASETAADDAASGEDQAQAAPEG